MAFTSIDSYMWSDEEKVVKLYIELPDVEKDNVTVTYTPTSVDIKIKDYKQQNVAKNLRLHLSPLNEEIVESTSTVRITPKRITITLAKKDTKKWWSLLKSTHSSYSPNDD